MQAPLESSNNVQQHYDQLAKALQSRLIGRVGRGDQAAFKDLRRVFVQGLSDYLRERCADPCRAEGIVQEVFWRVWQEAGQFDPEVETPTEWVLKIAESRIAGARHHAGSPSRSAVSPLHA